MEVWSIPLSIFIKITLLIQKKLKKKKQIKLENYVAAGIKNLKTWLV